MQNTTIYRFFNEVWNSRNEAAITSFLSPDVIIHGLSPSTVTAGLESFKKIYDGIQERYHGMRIIISEVKVSGNTEVALCTVTATQRLKGKDVTFTGTCIADINNGLVTEAWCHFDLLTMHEQLGTFEPIVNYQVVSYSTLRRAIGFTGVLLPVVVVLGAFVSKGATEILPSISDYYFSTMGDVFVGCLCAVSFFLFCYRGNDNLDNRAANLAAFFALCVAFFPTSTDLVRESHIGLVDNPEAASAIHFSAAVLFFLTLSYISIFLFTKATTKQIEIQKRKRNRVYKTCGYVMLSCLAVLAAYFILDKEHELEEYKIVTALECIMLWAFGSSWLTKSHAIFADEDEQ